MKLSRLSKAQKKELFRTVRYSFLEHEELLSLNSNPNFELAKEYVIEGLSVKLASTLKNAPKNPGTQISIVMRNHMKQAKEILDKVADKLETKVEGQEMKNAFGEMLKKIVTKKPDGTNPPNPYLQKTNFNNMY